MNAQEIINAIKSGDSEEIESSVNTALSSKIAEALDDKRQEIGKTMFQDEETIEEGFQVTAKNLDDNSTFTSKVYKNSERGEAKKMADKMKAATDKEGTKSFSNVKIEPVEDKKDTNESLDEGIKDTMYNLFGDVGIVRFEGETTDGKTFTGKTQIQSFNNSAKDVEKKLKDAFEAETGKKVKRFKITKFAKMN